MQQQQFAVINLIGPLTVLLLLSATLMLPWVSFPALADFGLGWLFRAPAILETASTFDFYLDSNSAALSAQEIIGSIKVADVIIMILAVIVVLLLLLGSFILLIVAFVRGGISGAVKGIASSKVSIILLAAAQLCGVVATFVLNARLTSNIDTMLQSQGISRLPLAVISPSLFLWGLLVGSLVCFIVLCVVSARLRGHRALSTPPAVS